MQIQKPSLRASWMYDLVEEAVALDVCTVTRGLSREDTDVVILCPHALYILGMQGQLRLMRLLDVEASCLSRCALDGGVGAVHNVLVANYSGSLHVYEDVTTSWCATLGPAGTDSRMDDGVCAECDTVGHVNVARHEAIEKEDVVCALRVLVSRVCGVSGMMVILDSSATLSICYLGTGGGSAVELVGTRIASSSSYDEMTEELQAIQRELTSVGVVTHVSSTALCGGESAASTSLVMTPHMSPSAAAVATATRQENAAPPPTGRSSSSSSSSSLSSITAAAGSAATAHAQDKESRCALSARETESPPRLVLSAQSSWNATTTMSTTQSMSVWVRSSVGVLEGVVIQVESTEPIWVKPRRVEVGRVTDSDAIELVFTYGVDGASSSWIETAHDLPHLHQTECAEKSLVKPKRKGGGGGGGRGVNSLFVSSLQVTVLALYDAAQERGTRVCRPRLRSTLLLHTLPFALVARTCAAMPAGVFVMQLNTNQSVPPSLIDLFPDVASLPGAVVHPHTLSFRLVDGACVRVLVSKNAARFKLQAASMLPMGLLAAELVQRLRHYYAAPAPHTRGPATRASLSASSVVLHASGDVPPPLVLSIPDEIPLCAFVLLIQAHMHARVALTQALDRLDRAGQLMDAVQRRLLARYRQDSPCSAAEAMVSERVLAASGALLQRCANRVERAGRGHREACTRLDAGARLFELYLEMQYADVLEAHPQDRALLQRLLRCDVNDGTASVTGMSWEEVVEETLLRAMNMTSSVLPLPMTGSYLSTRVGEREEALHRERVGTGGSVAQLQICLQQLILRLGNGEAITQ